MKRIKLNIINLFFHYFVSILLLTFGPLCLIKSLVETFKEELLWQRDNLLHGGILMIFIGFFTVRREIRALEFNQIDLNGVDKNIAYQYFIEILKDNKWMLSIDNETEIRATGYTSDNKSIFFSSPKQLTIKFYEQIILINCIVEPPRSNQITFGRNNAIVKKLTNTLLEKFEQKANT